MTSLLRPPAACAGCSGRVASAAVLLCCCLQCCPCIISARGRQEVRDRVCSRPRSTDTCPLRGSVSCVCVSYYGCSGEQHRRPWPRLEVAQCAAAVGPLGVELATQPVHAQAAPLAHCVQQMLARLRITACALVMRQRADVPSRGATRCSARRHEADCHCALDSRVGRLSRPRRCRTCRLSVGANSASTPLHTYQLHCRLLKDPLPIVC